MINIDQLADALARQIQGTSRPEDEALIKQWLDEDERNRFLYQRIIHDDAGVLERLRHINTEQALVRLHRRAAGEKKRKWATVGIAASLLLLAGLLLTYPRSQKNKSVDIQASMQPGDITPASNQAVLVLGNGQKIHLSTQNDTAFIAGSISLQQREGQLSYEAAVSGEPRMQQLVTPMAGKFSVVLPDGTTVWLNAASELHFPERFAGSERKVSLSGEGYFEVAKDAAHPFTVSLEDGSKVQVLGTVFNVKAYGGKRIRATLLEGAVRVAKAAEVKVLKPGEMALIEGDGILTGTGDIAEATGWHENKFVFHQTEIAEVLAEMARWYDLTIAYDKHYKRQEERYTGEISRSVTLDRLLKMLAQTGVGEFELKERTLYVKP